MSVGNFDCALPSPDNEIAASLKSLHASLKHLTWQAQQVAKGDYNQRVDFMGDFSIAFNNMIEQLNQRHMDNQEEKSRLEIYLQLILANSPNLIWLFNERGQLNYASTSCFQFMAEYGVHEILGKNLSELLVTLRKKESRQKIIDMYESAAIGNKTIEDTLEIIVPEGDSHRIFKVQISPMLNFNDIFKGMMIFLVDMTAIIKARHDAESAREIAEQSSRSKTNFLARMSHEIRTPMNAIIGMSELALNEDLPPVAHEHLHTINQAGVNLLSIINDILDLSKIETGKLEIISSEYHLSSLIYDAINIIKTKVLESRLRFIVNIDNNLPNVLLGDAVRIRQILLNLLSNAVKYTVKGFISLSINGQITDDQRVILTIKVSDSGKGIKKEDIEKLFMDFSRVDVANNYNIEGTGLGLAITRNLVRSMGGDIEVKSEYGEGSSFTATLPQKILGSEKLAAVENPENKNVLIYERREICISSITQTMDALKVPYKLVASEEVFYEEVMSNKYQFIFLAAILYERVKKKYREFRSDSKILLIAEFGEPVPEKNISVLTTPIFSIPVARFLNGNSDTFNYDLSHEFIIKFIAPAARVLVVDDILTNLKVAEGLLLPYKIQVDVCKNALDAIANIKSESYDMVFMDHMMPEIDGIEATARIRALGGADSYYKKVPIIALTANAVSGVKEMFLENAFDDFLPKPINSTRLNAILEKWLPKEKIVSSAGIKLDDPAKQIHDAGIEIQGVNIKNGLEISNGSVKNYLETLEIFSEDGIEKIKLIKECLDAGNIRSYIIHVHALKSALANIGALALSDSAKELEIAGKQEDLIFIHAHNASFIMNLEILLLNISKETAKRKSKQAAPAFDEIKLIKAELLKLKEGLTVFDSSIIKESVNRLKDFTQTDDIGVAVSKIIKDVLIGDYDEVNAVIDSLSKDLD